VQLDAKGVLLLGRGETGVHDIEGFWQAAGATKISPLAQSFATTLLSAEHPAPTTQTAQQPPTAQVQPTHSQAEEQPAQEPSCPAAAVTTVACEYGVLKGMYNTTTGRVTAACEDLPSPNALKGLEKVLRLPRSV
jgi:hypothetical protein